ncbi:MAG: ATP-binding protein [Methylococcaceae bacterium]|nr:ATP-binding protein [Methylococcaceae bacterium]
MRVLKRTIRRLLEVSSFRFIVLFLVVAVLVSVMIVLTIDFAWDGRFNPELEFAGVLTPFLDGLLLVVFVTAMFGEIREEADRREAAERILNEAQRIAKIGNWSLELKTDTLNWSEEAFRIFEIDSPHFGASYEAFLDLVHPQDRERVNEAYRRSLKDKGPYQISHRLLMKDGRIKQVLEQGETFYDPSGEPLRTIGTVQDITASQQAEDAIRKLNEELEEKVRQRTQKLLEMQDELVRKEKLAVLGQVADSVGHELRNPLGVLSNAVYFLKTVLPESDETVCEYLDIMNGEIANANRIVSELLDAVRNKPSHVQSIAVKELIDLALRECNIPPQIQVIRDFSPQLPSLQVDINQLQQALRNLVGNAVEAMPGGGELEFDAFEDEASNTLSLSVRDSGIGIREENMGSLFQPLFTTKSRGIGLGLMVVKNLTEANGGRVIAHSEWGKGSTFTLILPIDQSLRCKREEG